MKKFASFLLRAMPLAFLLFLSACAVGPDFKSPEPIAPDSYSYTETPPVKQTEHSEGKAGVSQKLVLAEDIPAQWWELFSSKELNQLILEAIARNPDLASADAALRVAQENYSALVGQTLLPNVSAGFSAQRQKLSAASAGAQSQSLYNLFSASVNVSYTFDVFGANRRAIEDLGAAVEYQQFQLEAAHLALTSNLVTAAINEAAIRAQIKAQNEILAAQIKQLEVIKSRFITGAISKVDVLNQQSFVAQTRAALPPLEKALHQTRHQLAVYAGRLPGDAELPTFELNAFDLPTELPISIPSALVRQRPDIRASEALLHRASAQWGVATANLFPQFTITGAYDPTAFTVGTIFTGPAQMWSIAGNITQPLFQGGALFAKRRAAEAFFNQQNEAYRSIVLNAFRNVADTLEALQRDAQTLKEQVDVVTVAKQNLDLATLQFGFGAINSLTLLDVKRTHQTAVIALVTAQAARYADTVALFQALGGGWWNRGLDKEVPTNATETE